MAVAKLTKTIVEGMGKGERIWDTAVGGFGVRRQTTDAAWYLLRYTNRATGQQRTISIGRHGSPWTVDSARTEARRLLGLVASGRDPLAEKQQQRDERKRPKPAETTFGEAAEAYIAAKMGSWKPGSAIQIKHHLRKLSKPLHHFALSEINRRRVADVLAQIQANSGPIARNRTRTSISAMFTWLDMEGRLPEGLANPASGTARAEEAPSRERVLTRSELAEVWAALPDDHVGDVLRLLILTGQRRNEIAKLRWSEIDFDKALIVLPPARTKNKRTHELPLVPQALAILQRRAVQGNGARTNDGRVFEPIGWGARKIKLDAAILAKRRGLEPKAKPMPHWIIHDLRRTAATGMADLGVLPHIIEAILNHVSGHKGGVAGIYNRARYEEPMREALAKWGAHVEVMLT